MALKTNEFILLKMIFNQDLYNAVLAKDEQKIVSILNSKYSDEMNDKAFVIPEPINIDYLYTQYHIEDEQERKSGSNYKWAL